MQIDVAEGIRLIKQRFNYSEDYIMTELDVDEFITLVQYIKKENDEC